MAITQKEWGALPDNRVVSLFHLDDGEGVSAEITNYGGIITSLKVPDKDGRSGEIGLGFDSLDGYLKKRTYFGALIGRVGNRIANGKFRLDGKEYQLNVGPDGNSLHGGTDGFNVKLWDATVEKGRLRLEYLSQDGEENYPGNLKVTVWYEVRERDLIISYEATTDKPTIVNLTNHEFFNLNGCVDDVLRHEVMLRAKYYTPVDDNLIPTGEILSVTGTPLDFTTPKAIGRDLPSIPEGYDHNFVLDKTKDGPEWLAEVYEPTSGRLMEVATTEPCMQFYIGNFLDGSDVGIGGTVYKKRYGFCLEAQKHPDSINNVNFANTILRPGETYTQTTMYRFRTRRS